MSSARRRKLHRNRFMDTSIMNDCIYISKEYKSKFLIMCLAVLIGASVKSAILGYLFAMYKKQPK